MEFEQNVNSGGRDHRVYSGSHKNDFDEENEDEYEGFSQVELQNLRHIFEMFDKDRVGTVDVSDLESIFASLNHDAGEAKILMERLYRKNENKLTFDQFTNIILELESNVNERNIDQSKKSTATLNSSAKENNAVEPDNKVIDFLKLLEEYRKKCESEGDYAEAKKARAKFDELKKKESIRQQNNIRSMQDQELHSIESAQKTQITQFNKAWDTYMADYEATAYLSLEKLREKHMFEFQQYQDKIRKEERAKLKFSKNLLELRQKEQLLVKMKQYEEAEKVKSKADTIEGYEKEAHEEKFTDIIEKKEEQLRKQQQLSLSALLKRIQRDRSEQLQHRKLDSTRLAQRNKNILNDLLNKQVAETKKTLDQLKQNLDMVALDKVLASDDFPYAPPYSSEKVKRLATTDSKTPSQRYQKNHRSSSSHNEKRLRDTGDRKKDSKLNTSNMMPHIK